MLTRQVGTMQAIVLGDAPWPAIEAISMNLEPRQLGVRAASMIESPARITRVEGATAWVVSEAPSSCGACGGKGCGSSLFARMTNPREPEFRVDNPIAAQAGELVVLGVPEGTLLRAALVSYIAPLVLLIGGAGMGQYLGGEPISALGGLFGAHTGRDLAGRLWTVDAHSPSWPGHPAAGKPRPAPRQRLIIHQPRLRDL